MTKEHVPTFCSFVAFVQSHLNITHFHINRLNPLAGKNINRRFQKAMCFGSSELLASTNEACALRTYRAARMGKDKAR